MPKTRSSNKDVKFIVDDDDSEEITDPDYEDSYSSSDFIDSLDTDVVNANRSANNMLMYLDGDKKAYENFKTARQILDDEIPDLKHILTIPMRDKNRAKLLELYEIYKTHHPLTEESISFKMQINKLCKVYEADYHTYSNMPKSSLTKMKTISKNLKRRNPVLVICY